MYDRIKLVNYIRTKSSDVKNVSDIRAFLSSVQYGDDAEVP